MDILYISFQVDAEITDVDDAIFRCWSTIIGPATVQSTGLLADYFLEVHDAFLPPRMSFVPLTSQTENEEEEVHADLQGDLDVNCFSTCPHQLHLLTFNDPRCKFLISCLAPMRQCSV